MPEAGGPEGRGRERGALRAGVWRLLENLGNGCERAGRWAVGVLKPPTQLLRSPSRKGTERAEVRGQAGCLGCRGRPDPRQAVGGRGEVAQVRGRQGLRGSGRLSWRETVCCGPGAVRREQSPRHMHKEGDGNDAQSDTAHGRWLFR